jgi:hypothetical protein
VLGISSARARFNSVPLALPKKVFLGENRHCGDDYASKENGHIIEELLSVGVHVSIIGADPLCELLAVDCHGIVQSSREEVSWTGLRLYRPTELNEVSNGSRLQTDHVVH